jgi:hypothetical protein
MKEKLNVLFLVVLCGLLLGISPQTRLVYADDEPASTSHHDHIACGTIQFLLVHIERETLEEHMDESNVPILDAISIEQIGECIRHEDGAKIVSQTKLTFVEGIEAEMTFVESERRKAKNGEEEVGEEGQQEAEVSVWLKAEIHEGDTLAAQFTYKRRVEEETHFAESESEKAEGGEQKFEISSGIVLRVEQACIAGANMNEDVATLLIMKADLT